MGKGKGEENGGKGRVVLCCVGCVGCSAVEKHGNNNKQKNNIIYT
jgi:hypothetical protein